MNDPSAKSPDPGFVPFRAAAALSRERTDAVRARREAPPLPPAPPGAPAAEVRHAAPAARPARGAPRPATPPPGAAPEAAWEALLAWCREAGIAEGGLAAWGEENPRVVAGDLGPGAPAAVARQVRNALRAARDAGEDATAVAVDVSGRWVTGFLVPVPGGEALLCLSGKAPVRADLRAALGAWIAGALRGS
jgi:hypothetical protein